MTAHTSPEYGERLSPAKETALRHAFDGLLVVGDAVVRPFETGGGTGSLEALGLHAAVTPQERNRRRHARKAGMNRAPWPGMREALHGQDRIALDLRHALRAAPDAVPAADPEIVKRLWLMKGFGRDGDVISLHGVPVPASAEQVRYFTVLRYRPLFSPLADPARIYCGDQAHDADNTTDALQERIILVSTRGYRDTLIALLTVNFDLFAAIWLRQMVRADRLIDGMTQADLPPCYGRSKIGNRKTRLRITCAVMNEYERGFDLLHALRDEVGVSRQSVRDALKACSSMSQLHCATDGTHTYLAGSVAHMRAMHPTMNRQPAAPLGDPVFAQVRNAFDHSALHVGRFRRVRSMTPDLPSRLFCGVERAMLLAVMLIQMVESMTAHEGRFWTREISKNIGKEYRDPDRRSRDVMSLATIMTGAICVPSARAIMRHGDDDGSMSDAEWTIAMVRQLFTEGQPASEADGDNDHDDISWRMEAGVSAMKTVEETDEDFGDRFKNTYAEARKRARLRTSGPGKHGWTQGFYFDAWWKPDAEIGFLRKCSRFIRHDPALARKAQKWSRTVKHVRRKNGKPMTPADCYTGLPAQHPVERVQDLFRPYFDLVQVPELVCNTGLMPSAFYREALICEIARLLPALSPITDDPSRYEMLWQEQDLKALENKSPLEHREAMQAQALAVEGAWNC